MCFSCVVVEGPLRAIGWAFLLPTVYPLALFRLRQQAFPSHHLPQKPFRHYGHVVNEPLPLDSQQSIPLRLNLLPHNRRDMGVHHDESLDTSNLFREYFSTEEFQLRHRQEGLLRANPFLLGPAVSQVGGRQRGGGVEVFRVDRDPVLDDFSGCWSLVKRPTGVRYKVRQP